MSRITDERLTKLLRALPRREASSEFTRGVLNRLGGPARPRLLRRHPFWAVGTAAAVVVVGLTVGAFLSQQSERRQTLERIESLRTEYRELETELQSLRALARELDPVIELGGTERVDFVFDLREHGGNDDHSGVRPASHTTGVER